MKFFNRETYSLLSAPFPVDRLKFRIGSTYGNNAKPLTYIDARDVYERLDEVLDPDGWGNRYDLTDGRVTCTILVHTDHGVLEKSNGAGETTIEGDKGAYSDAIKRAAVLLGVGRYLYETDLGWWPFEKKGERKYFSERTIAELRKTMANIIGGDNETVLKEIASVDATVSGGESTEGTKQVKTNGVTLTGAKKTVREELMPKIAAAKEEEDLLTIICEYADFLAKLADNDDSNKHYRDYVNWYYPRNEGMPPSIKDQLIQKAFDFGGAASCNNVIAVLKEHVESY